ncbi:uncharacterized protein LOC111134125 [Crassostrea virginica]
MPSATDDLIFLFLSTFFIVGNTQSTCRPTGSDGVPVCCPYYYIKDNICVGCQAGYRVLSDPYSCSDMCNYPSYGARCSERCDCSKEDCHHVHGCHITTTVVTTQKTTSTQRTTILSFLQRKTTRG